MMEKIKKLFQSAGTKNGAYSVGITAIVIAIVVVVNLIFGQMPEKYRNVDVSSTKIYEITDTSKELLGDLKQEVKFTILAVKDDTDERIRTFISKYAALSKNITVEWIDPVLHPSALTEYEAEENSMIVSCEETGKQTTVSFSDIIVSDMASYYYTGSASESEFDGEGQLTAAVNYVTSDVQKKIYRTAGHGESALGTTITDLMEKNNYSVTELNLLMSTKIPDDCDLLLMYAPTNDLTEDEKTVVSEFLAGGGKMMLLLGDSGKGSMPNLEAIMKEYGMEIADGYIADPQRCYQGNPYYIFPELSVYGDMAKGISSEMVLLINAHGLNLTDAARDTVTTESFMATSDGGYAVTEETQTQGSYTLGAVATETVDAQKDEDTEEGNADSDADETEDSAENDETADDEAENTDGEAENDGAESTDSEEAKESRLTVISSASMIDSQITDAFSTLENTTLFMNAVAANFDGVQNLSIEPKSLAVEYNTVQHAGILSLAVIFGIPALLLIGGFVVWFRRRKQ